MDHWTTLGPGGRYPHARNQGKPQRPSRKDRGHPFPRGHARPGKARPPPPFPPSLHRMVPTPARYYSPFEKAAAGGVGAAGRGLSLTQDLVSSPSSNERAAWGLRTGTSSSSGGTSSRKRVVFVQRGKGAEPGFQGPLGLGQPRGAEGGRATGSARLSSPLTTAH